MCLIFPIQFFPLQLLLRCWTLLYLRALDSLRKQLTFRNTTSGFLVKWCLRNKWRSSILMTCHNPDLGSLWHIISALAQTSFHRETRKPVVVSQNIGRFLRLSFGELAQSLVKYVNKHNSGIFQTETYTPRKHHGWCWCLDLQVTHLCSSPF